VGVGVAVHVAVADGAVWVAVAVAGGIVGVCVRVGVAVGMGMGGCVGVAVSALVGRGVAAILVSRVETGVTVVRTNAIGLLQAATTMHKQKTLPARRRGQVLRVMSLSQGPIVIGDRSSIAWPFSKGITSWL
jgi:hypothetical protein